MIRRFQEGDYVIYTSKEGIDAINNVISEGLKEKIDKMCKNGEIKPLKYDYKFLYWDEYDKEKKENTSTNKRKPRKHSKKK